MVKDCTRHLQKLDNDDKRALRDGFGDGMMLLGESNPSVVALCADLTESDRLVKFRDTWPSRYVEVGVAEQNLAGVGAGMARVGKIPFTASFAVFHPGRSWDQIRVSICYSDNNVKIYGGHAGITVGEDGATHQALEDIAIMRVLPRMRVIVPADAIEMRKATLAAAREHGPFYLRGGREKQPQVTKDDTPFVVGEANLLRKGRDVAIVACGVMVREALLAAEALKKLKIDARVLNMHTIKPIDTNAIIEVAQDTGAIVTAEEHQVTAGLGGAVAEVLAEHVPVHMERVGVSDTFGESGTAGALMDKYGLRAADIVTAVKRVLARKKRGKRLVEFSPSGRDVKKLPKAAVSEAKSPEKVKKKSKKASKKVAKKSPNTKKSRKKR